MGSTASAYREASSIAESRGVPSLRPTWSRVESLERLQRAEVGGSDLEDHLSRKDLSDYLAGDVANLYGFPRLDCETVKNVVVLIAFRLRDRADEDTIGGDDVPALLDLQPRNGITHTSVVAP